jgi:hypothetical protein
MIITARLSAIPATEIRIIGAEKESRFSLLKINRVAMKIPVFNVICV